MPIVDQLALLGVLGSFLAGRLLKLPVLLYGLVRRTQFRVNSVIEGDFVVLVHFFL